MKSSSAEFRLAINGVNQRRHKIWRGERLNGNSSSSSKKAGRVSVNAVTVELELLWTTFMPMDRHKKSSHKSRMPNEAAFDKILITILNKIKKQPTKYRQQYGEKKHVHLTYIHSFTSH